MSRLRDLAFAVVLLAPAAASAQSAAERASALNDEGKKLIVDQQSYEAAHAKFVEAARLSPEGRFFFNDCYALNSLERYEEAIRACEQVEGAGADEKLIEKTQKVRELEWRLSSFMDSHIYPNEARYYREAEELGPWKVYPVVEELKPLARNKEEEHLYALEWEARWHAGVYLALRDLQKQLWRLLGRLAHPLARR